MFQEHVQEGLGRSWCQVLAGRACACRTNQNKNCHSRALTQGCGATYSPIPLQDRRGLSDPSPLKGPEGLGLEHKRHSTALPMVNIKKTRLPRDGRAVTDQDRLLR